jgi:FkbM family methyltransferase
MTCKILFAASYPNIPIGYSKVGHFISTTLAEHESVEVVYFGFSNFPNNPNINREFHPKIKYIDVFQEENEKFPNNPDTYGTNIFIQTLLNEKPNIVFLYNDIIVVSRLLNKLLEYRTSNVQKFSLYTYLDLVYDCERTDYLRHVFNNSDKVVLFTEYWKQHLCDMGFPSHKMHVLYHALDSNKFPKLDTIKSKIDLGFPANSFIILNANRNSYRKAIDISIRSFLIFLKEKEMNSNIFLMLHTSLDSLSGYKLLNVIETECLLLGLNFNQIVNNHILQLKDKTIEDETMNVLYNACDVGINTCIGEGFGLCNAEHSLLGKPQIVSSVGGLRDIFKDTLALVEPRSSYHIANHIDEHNGVVYICHPDDIVKKLTDIFNNYEEYSQHFKTISSTLKQRYNIDTVKLQLYDIFNLNINNTKVYHTNDLIETYNTKYGKISLYKNEVYIGTSFRNGNYWDIDTLLKLRKYINPNRNILEIGGHCGTSSIVYSTFLNNKKVYVYEPQRNMYNLLVENINQNSLETKIIPNHSGVFCYDGNGKMNNIDIDGGLGIVSKRYNEENNLGCNFGGIGLGDDGEDISLTTIDNMKLDDIGYIHCDAQGSENFIFSKGIETIKKYRPVILYENNQVYDRKLYDNVCKSYPEYKEQSVFDIKKYCMQQLNYSQCIDKFNGSIDTLLIP